MKPRVPRAVSAFLADHRLHEFLWFCVPGIAVALAIRAWLMIGMPFGYYHPDSHDFMTSIYFLEAHHHWAVHGKVTFLTPLLYALAFLVPKIPALMVIPFGQHLRGILLVLMIGALARWWFTFWRWLIVPLMILAALDPAMIFWEHALTSESGFVFGAVSLAFAGTVFCLWPGWPALGLLALATFLTAAARPEGNLWQAAAVLVVPVVYWGHWRTQWLKIVAITVLAGGMFTITKTSHSGLLLYASLVHFTPDEPKTLPGFGPYIRPLRDERLADRNRRVDDDVVRASKRVIVALDQYFKDHPPADTGHASARKQVGADAPTDGAKESLFAFKNGYELSDICRRLAIESAAGHPRELVPYATRKFVARIDDDPGGTFDDYTFGVKQAFSLFGNGKIATTIGRGLTGGPIDTPEQANAFVDEHYDWQRVQWFNKLDQAWFRAVNHFALPTIRYSADYRLPGLPFYYVFALLGMVAAVIRPTAVRRFQWCFVATLVGAMFVVMLTAAVIPRHRFVCEPFWLLYFFMFADTVAVALAYAWPRRSIPSSAIPAK